jgi:hypothetical protein
VQLSKKSAMKKGELWIRTFDSCASGVTWVGVESSECHDCGVVKLIEMCCLEGSRSSEKLYRVSWAKPKTQLASLGLALHVCLKMATSDYCLSNSSHLNVEATTSK